MLAIPTPDLDATNGLWRAKGLPVTLEPEDAYWARIFYGLDPDGYEAQVRAAPHLREADLANPFMHER